MSTNTNTTEVQKSGDDGTVFRASREERSKLNRRNFMRAAAVAGGAGAVAGGSAGVSSTSDLDLSPVGDVRGVAPLVVPAWVGLSAVAAAFAGGAAIGYWLDRDKQQGADRDKLAELADASARARHAEVARAVDALESRSLTEREQRFNISVTLDRSTGAVTGSSKGDATTTDVANLAWTEVSAGVGTVFLTGGSLSEVESEARRRAWTAYSASAISTLADANASLEALVGTIVDQTARSLTNPVLEISSGNSFTAAAGIPSGSGIVSDGGTKSDNDPVIISVPLQFADDGAVGPSELPEIADDYEPRVWCYYNGSNWVPAFPVGGSTGSPFDYADSVNTTNLNNTVAGSITGDHSDLDEYKFPYVGASWVGAKDQWRDGIESILSEIPTFVSQIDSQIAEGSAEPEDLIGAREVVERFADTSNFSRMAAELVGAGYKLPGDGSLATQAKIAHPDLTQLESEKVRTFASINTVGEPGIVTNSGYICSFDSVGTMHVYQISDGSVTKGGTISPSTIANDPKDIIAYNDIVYAIGSDGNSNYYIERFDPANLSNDWVSNQYTSGIGANTLTYSEDSDVLLFGGGSSNIVKLNPTDGSEINNVSTTSNIGVGSAVSDGGSLYVSNPSGNTIQSYSVSDLTNNYSTSLPSISGTSGLALKSGNLWTAKASTATSSEPELVEIDPSDGSETNTYSFNASSNYTSIEVVPNSDLIILLSTPDDRADVFDVVDSELEEGSSINISGDIASVSAVSKDDYFVFGHSSGGYFESNNIAQQSIGGVASGDDRAVGHLFVDGSGLATIQEGDTIAANSYESAYLLTIPDDSGEFDSVILESDDGPIDVLEVIVSSDTEDSLNNANTDSTGNTRDTSDGSNQDDVETSYYLELPGDNPDLEKIAGRGDILINIVKNGTVQETRNGTDIVDISGSDADPNYVLETSTSYTDVEVRYRVGFQLEEPVTGVVDPSDPKNVLNEAKALLETIKEIEKARKQAAAGGSDNQSDLPLGLLLVLGGVGVIAKYILGD